MSNRHFKRDPSYRKHKASGQAIVTVPDGLGGRRDFLLGKYGTASSRAAYRRIIAEWEGNGYRLKVSTDELTVNELIAAYWPHVENHYRRGDGTMTQEVTDTKMSLRPLAYLYGDRPGMEFSPLALQAVRQLMVKGYEHPKYGSQAALARGVINQRIGRIRRMFKWAVSKELTPSSVYHGLLAVRGLEQGRSAARETDGVKSVPAAHVDAILPFLSRQVAAMVQLQRATGMRSGEVCIMRTIDLDTSGKVWLYRPTHHKMAYRGHSRVVAIGPQGQEILRLWLRLNLEEYLFQPREAAEELRREMRANRKTRVQPSQLNRKKRSPRKQPGERYTSRFYQQAIAKGIEKMNKARSCEACKDKDQAKWCPTCSKRVIPHWHPHQLRHLKARDIQRVAGLDAARAALGHRSVVITQHYAELDLAKAIEVMAKIG